MPRRLRCYVGIHYYDFWIFLETTKAACGRAMEEVLNNPSVTATSLSKLVGEVHYDRSREVLWFKAKGAHHSVHPSHIPAEAWTCMTEKQCPKQPYKHSSVSKIKRSDVNSSLPVISSRDFDAKVNAALRSDQ